MSKPDRTKSYQPPVPQLLEDLTRNHGPVRIDAVGSPQRMIAGCGHWYGSGDSVGEAVRQLHDRVVGPREFEGASLGAVIYDEIQTFGIPPAGRRLSNKAAFLLIQLTVLLLSAVFGLGMLAEYGALGGWLLFALSAASGTVANVIGYRTSRDLCPDLRRK